MSDDIVTRLREMWGDDDRCIWCKKHMDSASSPHRSVCDLMEAADEIERLRALLESTEESDDYEQEPSDYYERQISDDARRD